MGALDPNTVASIINPLLISNETRYGGGYLKAEYTDVLLLIHSRFLLS